MKRYLLSVYQPDGPGLSPEELEPIVADVHALTDEMKHAGAWVFSAGLNDVGSATVVRVRDGGDALITDGPFAEGKEHIGGFTIIQADDLDAALEWAGKAARATRLPIELRPMVHGEGS
ncbi:MAG TPA: YciI family protein [Conexibacter sp.]|jgi:hypothetical protein